MRTVFPSLLVVLLLATLDTTLTGTVAPALVAELGGGARVGLVVIAYATASTLTIPLWGRAGDLRGHGRILLVALAVFLLGSACCGAARDMAQLVAARTVQGLGAGGLMVGVVTVVATLVPPRERPRYQGYVAAVTALAMIGGPLAGGWLTDLVSWRLAYLINLPLGGVAFAVLLHSARRTPPAAASARRTPPAAANPDNADHSLPAEQRRSLAIVPLRLLGVRNFVLTGLLAPLQGAVMLSAVTYLPLHLQRHQGVGAAASGMLLLPLLGASVAASFAAGRLISATGRYKLVLVAGTSLTAAGAAAVALTGVSLPAMATIGLGGGMLMQLVTLVAQNSVPAADVGVASGAGPFLRQLGGVAGVALTGALYETGSLGPAFAALTALAAAAVVVACLIEELPLRATTG
ncbi:MFS transporter [Nonomuraea sp. NN258]|uniref:MFS transporter n=1 Tax=Nonomuraea antri TaxID=2730852 RepID=UPI0015691D05|nr:MFS transporter [Nonomuraea antri]NRQ33646.1 MFS transporter [Nonomuraea antri]